MKKIVLLSALCLLVLCSFVLLTHQTKKINSSHLNPGEEYLLSRQYPAFGEGLDEYKKAVMKELRRMKKTRSIDFPWQNEGPYNTGGRINCIAVNPTSSNTYFIGCADGGIFKTTDNGATWVPVFDSSTSLSVSSIVYDLTNPSTLYAGTGDQVLGGYSHMGNGIYKSTNGGTTWFNSGLNNVGTITKIIIDPTNSNILYAGTTGNPFLSDNHRGVYKSTDGGSTWTNVLFLGLNAGIGDLVMNPSNPSILYATGRRRIRSNSQSIITGPEARIYKTSNGGNTWDTLTNGLPVGDQSRIGLCISANNPNLLFANYVDTSLNFGGLYKSVNGGTSWNLVNTTPGAINMGGFGWYFGEIRLDPANDNILYLLSLNIYKSTDGGLTFTSDNGFIHSDKHDLKFVSSNHLLLATDGGLFESTDAGANWISKNNFPITQFYEVAYNPWDTTNYYGGAQDNGSNYGSVANGLNSWLHYYGGDGFRPQFNQLDDQVLYAEWQNGNIVASMSGAFGFFNNITQSIVNVDRFSWNTPYFVSQYDPDILYLGSYRVYKNTSGPFDNWIPISPDLTDGTNDVFHVITTLDQSAFNSQLLYAGTSDARVWITQNDGGSWTLINAGLSNRNISCVLASPDSQSHVFVSQTGYRDNDSLPHIYLSKNYGSTWNSIAGNLPAFAINDIWVKPNSHDSAILVATDGGVYASKDQGISWERVGNNMPIIPVFDLDYNESTKRIMAGTFARSMMTMPVDSIFKPTPKTNDAVHDVNHLIACSVYPNPCNEYFSIKLQQALIKSATLYDVHGSVLKKYGQLIANEKISCMDIPSGYYIFSMLTDQGRVNKQIVIKR